MALDTSSRTSVALARMLLHDRLGRDPEYVAHGSAPAEMLRVADAALLIGDPALDLEGQAPSLDLGEEWTRVTGLALRVRVLGGPGRGGIAAGGQAAPGGPAERSGLRGGHRARATMATVRADEALYESYLRNNIIYTLGEAEVAGLREFYRRAHALGLIPRVPELRFHADA